MESGRARPNDRLHRLMMAAVDDEISAPDRAELDAALADDVTLRDEWEAFRRLREVTGSMTTREAPPDVWDSYWEGVYRRFERGIGWILASVGAIVVATWGSWMWIREFMSDTQIPPFIRWSVLALSAGLVILFVSVARERWFVRKSDPYKEVVR